MAGVLVASKVVQTVKQLAAMKADSMADSMVASMVASWAEYSAVSMADYLAASKAG